MLCTIEDAGELSNRGYEVRWWHQITVSMTAQKKLRARREVVRDGAVAGSGTLQKVPVSFEVVDFSVALIKSVADCEREMVVGGCR